MIGPDDLEHCRDAIRVGSRSFHAASLLLPRRYREPALALYAFCRVADDSVDVDSVSQRAVDRLRTRLDRIYAGRPADLAADRAFAAVVREYELPRQLPEALLEGFAWDAAGRRYATLSELRGYCARVAASVGAMMTVLMGVRDADALARACDLGVAMQLTNIARDVGEDAASGRLYLPLDDLAAAGLDPEAFVRDSRPNEVVFEVVRGLLSEAGRLYARADAGVAALPAPCRPGILAARHNYSEIGVRVAALGPRFMKHRAQTTRSAKLLLAAVALANAGRVSFMPHSSLLHAAPLPEAAFLVRAASVRGSSEGRSNALMAIFADLAARDRRKRGLARQPALGGH
jgi:phytoene synthase